MNFGMHAIDWAIVFALIVFLCVVLIYCQKYVKSTADFLAANRCAGRYLLCITGGIAGIGAISIIANFEQTYASGFSSVWWSFLSGPISLLLAITGWVSYRRRETRCLTLAQFFEVRYSRNFRIFCGILGWISGILNYGIFPAVSVKFFIYFCRLPETFHIPGIPFAFSTYLCLMAFAIGMGVIFAICGGQVAIMMTDFVQGIFCNIAFVILMLYLVRHFSWSNIFEALQTDAVANPGQSLFNPFETTAIRDFNIWFFIMGIGLTFLTFGTWQGSSGYSAAASSPHESKMSGFLGGWRELVQKSLLLFIPICAFTFFHHPTYSEGATKVNEIIQNLQGTSLTQARVPLFLAYILPTGLMGLFAAVMFAAMLSTDDTYMHSWGAILVQDVILPFKKKPFTPKQHLKALRWSIVFVGVFAFFFSWLFKQTEYILLFMQITGAIFMGGAGAVLIGGLYSKTGSTLGAWITMILGSFLAIGSIVLQQTWNPWIVNALIDFFENSPEKVLWLQNHSDRFPINGQILSFGIALIGFVCYFLVSFIERKVRNMPEFNLNKMLHRGEYDSKGEHVQKWTSSKIWRRLGLTEEFSFFDRILFFSSLIWTLIWTLCFVVGTIGNVSSIWNATHWLKFWKFYVMFGLILGLGTTVWFLIAGIRDTKRMFRTLATAKRNDADNGSVVDGQNAGED